MLQLNNWDLAGRKFADRAARQSNGAPRPEWEPQAFSGLYRSTQPPSQAVRDLVALRRAAQRGRDAADLRALPDDARGKRRNLRIFTLRERALDELTPIIANLGLRVLDQISFDVRLDGHRRFIRSFVVEPAAETGVAFRALRERVKSALDLLLAGEIENDPLNKLVGLAGFEWREIELLRAYCSYRLQLGAAIGRDRLYQALLNNVEVARLLYRYFATRFCPARGGAEFDALSAIRQHLVTAFEDVADVADDRILRDLFNLVDATLRTNFFFPRDSSRPLALKIDTMGVINAPNPKPFAEIYVRAGDFEGVHLRGAKVARGGLRWSDRLEDYRSEVLDLMQTQMVKNALIAPQGAKGGFVLKRPCADAAARRDLGKRAYGAFIRGLLDVTDNIEDGRITRPPQLVAYDNADPYLVVAADKGTANWSDEANSIAGAYSFWLGDAFATGGSQGYHHKELGITARGAWVCVKRHFHELGIDIDRQPFTVVGVGSMDGDVFGNGMLHSSHIRLIGAFSGLHIFLDPDPDPVVSLAERRRLYEKPNSTWEDYDAGLISPGGGVYRRDAKEIVLSDEARDRLRVRQRSVDGEGLIRLLLTAPVDLLWMGGIGTYVKASGETNEDADDRANDVARVDANRLRARVVGEGANLGFTQKARVEYALRGGRINTDAIDNSAGVDLSDHEVNLKILLRLPSDDRASAVDEDARNQLLAALTEEVCDSVLADNYAQSLSLSLERERSLADVEPFLDLADLLEVSGLLDRNVDAFPSRRDIATRNNRELTRPELAQLMAYAKLALKRRMLDAPEFLEAGWIQGFLAAYFPKRALAGRADRLERHPLAREIAAAVICNRIVDQAGACFLNCADASAPRLLLDATGLYLTFDAILEGDKWREAVRALDGKTLAANQYRSLLQLEEALAYLCRWALQRGWRLTPRDSVIAEWRGRLRSFARNDGEALDVAALASAPSERAAFLDRLRDFPFLVELSQKSGADMRLATKLFDGAVAVLGLRAISARLHEASLRDSWERQLKRTLDDRLRETPARIVALQLRFALDDPEALFARAGTVLAWERVRRLRAEVLTTQMDSLAAFAAFAAEADALVDACEERLHAGG